MKRTALAFALLALIAAACNPQTTIATDSGATPIPATPENPQPGAAGLGDPYLPEFGNGGYDVLHYEIDLDVEMETNELSGTVNILVGATQDLSSLNLDFLGLTIDELFVNEEEADFSRDGSELTIFLPTPVGAGQGLNILMRYHGTPGEGADFANIPEYEVGWGYYGDGVYVAGEPSGASNIYPVNEHPSDKATYTFRITVDEPYMVAANGLLEKTIDAGEGETTYVFEPEFPMSSYLATFGIGEFDLETAEGPDGLPVRNYFGVDVPSAVRHNFDRQPEMIEVFSELFGPYPFETYGVIVHDLDLGFALETQTLSVFGRGFTSDEVVSHELAHQWFGDSVGLASWQDIWLNEGFATYASVLWLEYSQSPDAAEEQLRDVYAQMALGEPIYQISKLELTSGLRDLLPPGGSFEAQSVEAALRALLRNALDEAQLDEMAASLPETELSSRDVVDVLEELSFTSVDLPPSHLVAFFAALDLTDLAQEFEEHYPPPGDPGADDLFSNSVYLRGGLTLAALRLEIGDEAFFETLQTYYERFNGGNASTEDFIAVAEEVSGQDLGAFFDAWLYQMDIPDIPELGLYRADFVED